MRLQLQHKLLEEQREDEEYREGRQAIYTSIYGPPPEVRAFLEQTLYAERTEWAIVSFVIAEGVILLLILHALSVQPAEFYS